MPEKTEQAAELRVRVRLAGGAVETVSPLRAARLFASGEAAPAGDWTAAEAHAVLEAHALRQDATARRLRSDGLLPLEREQGPEGGPWDWMRPEWTTWR